MVAFKVHSSNSTQHIIKTGVYLFSSENRADEFERFLLISSLGSLLTRSEVARINLEGLRAIARVTDYLSNPIKYEKYEDVQIDSWENNSIRNSA